jgi:hypothetical protein
MPGQLNRWINQRFYNIATKRYKIRALRQHKKHFFRINFTKSSNSLIQQFKNNG